MQRNNELSEILFSPPSDFIHQEGPLCYFYALVLAIQTQRKTSLQWSDLPPSCVEIVAEINQEYEISEEDSLDDKVDEVFSKYVTDEFIESLQLNCNGAPIFTVDDFMSEYPHSYAMGLLLGFKIDSTIQPKNLTLTGLVHQLRLRGPMTFDGGYGQNDAEHTILLVGCQTQPQELIYYIDPNNPASINAMSFQHFKEKLTDCGVGMLHMPRLLVAPSIDTVQVAQRLSVFQLDKAPKRKVDDLIDAEKNANIKRQRLDSLPGEMRFVNR